MNQGLPNTLTTGYHYSSTLGIVLCLLALHTLTVGVQNQCTFYGCNKYILQSIAIFLVEQGSQRQLAITKNQIQRILAHTNPVSTKDAFGCCFGFWWKHVPDFQHLWVFATWPHFNKAIGITSHFVVINLLQGFQNLAVLFLCCALVVDRPSDGTNDVVKAVITIQQRIFVLFRHEITPVHDLAIGINHWSQLVAFLFGQVFAWSRLEHISNLLLFVVHDFCLHRSAHCPIKRVGVHVATVLVAAFGFLVRDRQCSRQVLVQSTILQHKDSLGLTVRVCLVVTNWPNFHIALIFQRIRLTLQSSNHFYVWVIDFTGVAVHHQSVLSLEQTFFGFFLQSLVGFQNKLNTVATICAQQFIAHDFRYLCTICRRRVINGVQSHQLFNGLGCFGQCFAAHLVNVNRAQHTSNVSSVHHGEATSIAHHLSKS